MIYNNFKKKLYLSFKESPGMIYLNDKGTVIFNELKKCIREKLFINNYIEVKTPILMEKFLWKKTGHINFYKKNIYTINKCDYVVKPMNCPGHIKIFNSSLKSYKDLPYKILEFGNCYRNETSGSLNSIMRTKSFTQDDSHIFCTEENVESEIINSIDLTYEIYNIFKFKNIKTVLSTRPKNKIGNNDIWNKSENIVKNILNKKKINFEINEGNGAFYGPKIEFLLFDNTNKFWQCGTIQLDFFLSKNLNSYYMDKHNCKKYPIIIHRAILGSIERFMGIISDYYNDKYPLWLSPIQIVFLSITHKQLEYTKKVYNIFIKLGLRSLIDIKNNTLNFKLRKYIILNIPYIVICGENEVKYNKISIKTIYNENIKLISINKFLKIIINKIKNRDN